MSAVFVPMHYIPRTPKSAGTNETSNHEESPAKRQKIAVACDPCRSRKVRCNGARPVCQMCTKRTRKGAQCKYSDDVSGLPQVTPIDSSLPRGEQPEHYPLSGSSATGLSVAELAESGPVTSLDYQPHAQGLETTSFEAGPVGNSSAATVEEECGSQGFFGGSSSADSFLTQINSAIDKRYGLNSPESNSLSPTAHATHQKHSTSVTAEGDIASNASFVLPPRKTADYLLEVYWTLVYPIYPFLDRQRFEEAYRSVWAGSSSDMDEKVLFGTLNMVFALGCQVAGSVKPQNREDAAETYFLRAKELLPLELWGVGSPELIQCLLLMGQYLHSTNSHSCFMVVGQSIRIAQNLGFHLKGSKFDRHSTHDKELARIIWHACVMMDRIISMTFGRPTMIYPSLAKQVPAPAEQDFESGNQPRMIKAFFVRSLHLYEIINETLLRFYNDRDDTPGHEIDSQISDPFHDVDFAAIIKLDQALGVWSRRLPPHLCFPQCESSSNMITRRQAIYCRIRFQHARIILFRPVLAQFCGVANTTQSPHSPIDGSMTQSMALLCSRLCVRAAHDTISFVHLHLDRNMDPAQELPKWWFSIFYLNTAATVLLAARLQPKVEDGVSDISTDVSLARAIEVLSMFKVYSQSARRSLAALDVLSTKVREHVLGLRDGDRAEEPVRNIDRVDTNQTSTALNEPADEFDFSDMPEAFDIGFDLNLNDMSWLNSLPGIL